MDTTFNAGIPAFGTWVLYAFLIAAAVTFGLSVLAGTATAGTASRYLRAARLAALGTSALVAMDVLLLLYAFLSHDFRIRYVAHYSDRSMPLPYLMAALWGGQDGSLLWWTFLLSAYTTVCVLWLKGRYRELAPWVIATLMGVMLFFGVLMAFAANPFAATFGGAPVDGDGLNPSLQNFYMAIHPPSLYTGFVGCAVPFAFAVAALVTGRLDEEWVVAVRRWVLFAWMFLSIGNILGMLWAYEELGWGGFWAWDPVENAACLPWWTLTAYLHSVMTQERRGIFKIWNVSLLLGSFFLTIFGTFLTRSGLIASVHSFAQSGIGIYFVWFMGLLLLFSVALVLWRLPRLRRPVEFDSLLSREAAFVANNWLLLGICVFIALATVWPKVSEAVWNERLTVGASFYNAWLAPLGLLLFALMGVGTLTPWRKGSKKLLLEAFRGPLAVGLTAGVLHALVGHRFAMPAVVTLEPIYDQTTAIRLGGLTLGHLNVGRGLAWFDGHLPPFVTAVTAFNIATLVQEFVRGTLARMRSKQEPAPVALAQLVSRNRRRYGGYIVHLGFSMMMLGFLGAAFRQEAEATIAPGERFTVGRYTLRYDGTETRRDPNKREVFANVTLFRGADEIGRAHPARFIYSTHPEMPTTEVSITTTLREDIYLVMATVDANTRVAHLKAYVNPLTVWLWLGGLVLVAGVLVAMWPDASREAALAFAGRDRDEPARPAKKGPGATEAAALVALSLAALLAAPGEALAQPQPRHTGSSPMTVGVAERFSPEEHRLFDHLLCMCGDCDRLPLATCSCDFAAAQRNRMRERLGRGEPAQSIIDAYVARYGPAALTVPPDRGHNKALYIVPVAALIAAGVGAFAMVKRWSRRAQSDTQDAAKAASANPVDPAQTSYDARIEEELRGLDD
ncbi:MAG: cytochrome c biogenesis protein CcsA [Myxococcales bacterium]|nr:cytochrome c biogenesis protein CcsA [Myxococcales bacterium]